MLQVTPEDAALVRLERQSDGSWALTDDVHGAREGQPALFTLAPAQLGKARAVLEQYVRYALPLRMARRCTDLPGALQIRFLASPRFTGAPTDAERAALPELPMAKDSVYQLSPGTTFAVRIHNTSNQLLRVVLLASEASGNVAWLGDQIIDAKGTYEFWRENTLANPFEASLPEGSTQCLDRVVAIGTTALDKDLKYLSCDTTFADAVNPSRTLSKSSTPPAPPVDQWTATEILVRTR